jgi:nucleotide-binding universal stress UspA family protein
MDGAAVPVLIDLAGRERVDLIVVGSRGATGGESGLGRTSDQVARQAGRPVLVVPP